MTGRGYHATTVDALFQAMIVTTANTVTATIVRSAAHIARCAIPRFVLAVHTNVPHVMSRFVVVALPNARIAKKYSVRTV